MEWSALFWPERQRRSAGRGGSIMNAPSVRAVRCAIYPRVSTEYGLDQDFNSLDAQYDAASAYIKSQAHAGCVFEQSDNAPRRGEDRDSGQRRYDRDYGPKRYDGDYGPRRYDREYGPR